MTWCFTPSQPLWLYQGEKICIICVENGMDLTVVWICKNAEKDRGDHFGAVHVIIYFVDGPSVTSTLTFENVQPCSRSNIHRALFVWFTLFMHYSFGLLYHPCCSVIWLRAKHRLALLCHICVSSTWVACIEICRIRLTPIRTKWPLLFYALTLYFGFYFFLFFFGFCLFVVVNIKWSEWYTIYSCD